MRRWAYNRRNYMNSEICDVSAKTSEVEGRMPPKSVAPTAKFDGKYPATCGELCSVDSSKVGSWEAGIEDRQGSRTGRNAFDIHIREGTPRSLASMAALHGDILSENRGWMNYEVKYAMDFIYTAK